MLWVVLFIWGQKMIHKLFKRTQKVSIIENGKVNYSENMLAGDLSGLAIVFKSENKCRKEV